MTKREMRPTSSAGREPTVVSRRRFLAASGIAVGGTMSLPALLAACSGSSSSKPGRGAGTLKVAIDATPSAFDPATDGGPTTALIYHNVYDGLTGWKSVPYSGETGGSTIDWTADPSATVMRLAESMKAAPDHSSYTFKLRQGLKSHAGNELTADDVKWTFERTFSVKGIGSSLNQLTNIKSVTAVDKYTARFDLTAPSPSFPVDLNDYDYRGIIDSTEAKKHSTSSDPWATKWLATNAVGYGPYKLSSLQNGQQMVLSAAPDAPFPPKIKTILFSVVPEASSRLALLSSGDVDVAIVLQPTDLQKLSTTANVRVWKFPSNSIIALPLNVSKAPLNDVRVRQALAYATPYEALVSDVYKGFGGPSYGPLPTASTGLVDKTLWPYKLDIAKAKSLLQAAGVSGFSISYVYEAEDQIGEQIGVQLKTSWAQIGVKLTLDAQPQSAYNSNLYAGKFDTIFTNLGGDLPDPQYTLPLFYGKGGAANFNLYNNPRLNQMIAMGNTMTDSAKQFDYFRKDIAKVIIDDSPWLWLLAPGYQIASRTTVTGVNWYDGSSQFALLDLKKS